MTYQCKQCPENDPSKFYPKNRSRCKKCVLVRAKERYNDWDDDRRERYRKQVRDWQTTNIFQYRYLNSKARAKKKGIDFTITAADLERMFEEQSGKCFYSGMEMTRENDGRYSISVDRINSSKGYTPDNVVLVCYIVNSMKNDLGLAEFKRIVGKIYETLA